MKKPDAKTPAPITRGLVIREPWVSLIADGLKEWEMRTTATKIRGPIALIAGGSKQIIGVATLTAVKGPLGKAQVAFNMKRHRMSKEDVESGAVAKWNTAWVMKDAKRLATPIDYKHPSGAVIWVALDEKTQEALAKAVSKKSFAPRKKAPRP